jgi:hypothetical protein
MNLRRKSDGALVMAELGLHMLPNQPRRIVLVLPSQTDQQQLLGPMAAAIGYEIVECLPAERAALCLAGFHLSSSEAPTSLGQLAAVLAAAHRKPRRSDRPAKPRTHLKPKHRSHSLRHREAENNGQQSKTRPGMHWKSHTGGPHTGSRVGETVPRQARAQAQE